LLVEVPALLKKIRNRRKTKALNRMLSLEKTLELENIAVFILYKHSLYLPEDIKKRAEINDTIINILNIRYK
jgi:hypothetical protein